MCDGARMCDTQRQALERFGGLVWLIALVHCSRVRETAGKAGTQSRGEAREGVWGGGGVQGWGRTRASRCTRRRARPSTWAAEWVTHTHKRSLSFGIDALSAH